jgi:hypothetical protein
MTTKDIDECFGREIPCLLAAIPVVPDIQKDPPKEMTTDQPLKGISERRSRDEFA